jgi:O-antigen/teichoic acid export membrane protein
MRDLSTKKTLGLRRLIEISDASYGRGATLLLTGRVIQMLNSFAWSIVLLTHFGLATVGTFALGFVAVTVLSTVSPIGLPSFLPQVRQSHPRLCFAGLLLQLAVLPVAIFSMLIYARLLAQNSAEVEMIFWVGLSGVAISFSNTGLMLSIMTRRFHPAAFAPLCETAGIVAAAVGSASPELVAVYLCLSRFAGSLVIWTGMRMERMSVRRVIFICRRSISYLVPDATAIFSEQVAPLILQAVTARPELGLFRLCQQLLTASDTPGWTFVQSHYPEMVRSGEGAVRAIHRKLIKVALFASGIFVICGCGLALWVYHLPKMIPMLLVLSICLHWRYKNNLYDQGLRASGRVGVSTTLGILKLAGGVLMFFVMIHLLFVWGAIFALAALSIGAGVAYESAFYRSLVPIGEAS